MGLVTPVTAVPVAQLGRVHFVGIGGAGMSGIARLMLGRGVAVSGSDRAASAQLDELARLGATVRVGHDPANIDGADTVVTTPSAIGDRNPEIVAARQRGITVIPRASALASLMLGRQGIAVTGTHGKTTTTSMLTTVLRHGGADPSYVIGGILAETGDGAGEGTGEAFVVEADESDGSFLNLSPSAAVVTCIEAEHLDNYESLAQIQATFAAFAGQIRAGGLLVTCRDDPGAAALAADAAALPLRVRSYGESPGADYRLTGVTGLGMATRLTVTPPNARPQTLTGFPAGTTRSTPRPPWPPPWSLVCQPERPSAGSRPTAARSDAWSSRARRTACACSTATRTTRPSSRPTSPRPGRWPPAGRSSRCSSRTCTAGPGSSPRSSARRSGWPTRPWSSTSTRPARIPSPASPG